MGITAVSAANLTPLGKGAPSQNAAEGALDFAALLTQQLVGPQAADLELLVAPTLKPDTGLNAKDLSADEPEAGDDAAIAAVDIGALLAAAGLAPHPAQAPGSSRTDGIDPDASKGKVGELTGQPAGIPARALADELPGLAAKDDPGAGLAGGKAMAETANIAAEASPASAGEQNFAATLAAHTSHAQRAHAGAGQPAATVATPLHDSRWSQDFGEKIVWLAKNDQQVAQLNINPPQLGPMQITLNMNGDQASALFVSPHAEVRQAIQDAMPQLREMLAGAGINLGQANVGAQLPQQNGGEQPRFAGQTQGGTRDGSGLDDSEPAASQPLPIRRGGRGMVDLFA